MEGATRCLRKDQNSQFVAARGSETANASGKGPDQQVMAVEKAATAVSLVLLD